MAGVDSGLFAVWGEILRDLPVSLDDVGDGILADAQISRDPAIAPNGLSLIGLAAQLVM
jgi:hypothetical protein